VTEVIKRVEGIRQVILEIAASEVSLEVTAEGGSLSLTAAEDSRDTAS
jgi:hypothetical protein